MRLNMTSQGGLSDEFASGGGNVINPLFLLHDPQVSLEAATKQYVDNALGSLNANNLISGTLPTTRLPGMTGDLTSSAGSGNLTLSDTGVTPGTYAKVTVNAKGLITNGMSLDGNDLPDLDWSKVTTGKPTTLAGYEITDGISKSGDTATGYISVSSNPTESNQLANKGYIDSVVGGMGGITVGDIISKVEDITPSGFLKCNGAELDKTTYASLYAAIGDRYSSFYEYGSGKPWQQQYYINDSVNSEINYWTTSTGLPGALRASSVIVTNNRVHLLGGHNGTSYVATVYTAPINSDGTLGTWVTGTSLPGNLSWSQAIVTKNRVYLLGGYNTGGALSVIYTAPINSDGTLGTWGSSTNLPAVHQELQAIVTKNKVYLLGGASNSASVSTIYSANIKTDGSLDTWITENSLPGVLSGSQAIVTKNRVYLLGGHANGIYVSTVYTAPINLDGTLGTWTTGTSLPITLGYHQALVFKNKVYLTGGGSVGGITNNTVYTATINSDGTLGTWTTDTSLPGNLFQHQTVITKNNVYLIGGNNGSSTVSTVYTAPINGGLNDYSSYYANPNDIQYMEPGSGKPWQQQYQINETQSTDITGWATDISVLPGVLSGTSAIVTKNRVYCIGGATSGSTVVSTVYTAPINSNGTLGTWTTDISLPNVVGYAQAIVTKNRVYLIGGSSSSALISTVYTAPINSDGTLGTWTASTSLPGQFGYSTSVITKNRVYLLGGHDGSSYSGKVYTAPINIDGTLGTWTLSTSLPGNLSVSSAVVTKNRVYLLGGYNNSTIVSTVYTAFINSDGTLSNWVTDTSLPAALSTSQAIVTKNSVYLFGGSIVGDTTSVVYRAPINSDGTLGTWTTGTSLPVGLSQTSSIIVKDNIYLLGGITGVNTWTNNVYSATISGGLNDYSNYYLPDENNYMMPGSGKPWEQQYQINTTQTGDITDWSTGTSLPSAFYTAQAFVTKNRVYLLAGQAVTNTVSSIVYTAPINSDGTLGTWTTSTSLPSALTYTSAIVTKNSVYLLGGSNDTNSISTVYTAPINADGSIGTWTTGTSLPGALSTGPVVVTKNRVYLLGGYSTGYTTTVYTAPINSDGTLGTWTTGTSLPGVLCTASSIVTKNRVYILGGFNGGSYTSTVYTAPVNSDGFIGAWSVGTSLPSILTYSSVIVSKNRVYLLGGSNGSNVISTVFSAPINPDGTLGTWTTGTSLPGAMMGASVIMTKNRVYLLGGNNNGYISTVYTAIIAEGLNDYSPYYDGSINPVGYISESPTFKILDTTLSDTSMFHFIKY